LSALFILFGRVIRNGTAKVGVDFEDDPCIRVLKALTANLWVPVTFQFVLVGWLIYASGGIMNSPYSSVPIVMMMIGQSVYAAPSIEFEGDIKVRDVVLLLGRVGRAYRYPLLMVATLYLALMVLQENHPLVTHPAPAIEIVLTTLANLFFGMCVVIVTRRADRVVVEGVDQGS
jgi:hypothetical protein